MHLTLTLSTINNETMTVMAIIIIMFRKTMAMAMVSICRHSNGPKVLQSLS